VWKIWLREGIFGNFCGFTREVGGICDADLQSCDWKGGLDGSGRSKIRASKRKTFRRGTEGFSICFEAQVGAGPKTVWGEDSFAGGRLDRATRRRRRSYFFLVVFFAVDFLVDFLAAAFLAMALYLLSRAANVRPFKIGVNVFF
jgi:hypothetical protein